MQFNNNFDPIMLVTRYFKLLLSISTTNNGFEILNNKCIAESKLVQRHTAIPDTIQLIVMSYNRHIISRVLIWVEEFYVPLKTIVLTLSVI